MPAYQKRISTIREPENIFITLYIFFKFFPLSASARVVSFTENLWLKVC